MISLDEEVGATLRVRASEQKKGGEFIEAERSGALTQQMFK